MLSTTTTTTNRPNDNDGNVDRMTCETISDDKGNIVSRKRINNNELNVDVGKMKDCATLIEITLQHYVILTITPPLSALLINFLLAFSLDYQQFLDYDWSCGVRAFSFFFFNQTFFIELREIYKNYSSKIFKFQLS